MSWFLSKIKDVAGQVTDVVTDTVREGMEEIETTKSWWEGKEEKLKYEFDNDLPKHWKGKKDILLKHIGNFCEDEKNFLGNCSEQFEFEFGEYTDKVKWYLKQFPILEEMRFKLVPRFVKDKDFFRNFFFRIQGVMCCENEEEMNIFLDRWNLIDAKSKWSIHHRNLEEKMKIKQLEKLKEEEDEKKEKERLENLQKNKQKETNEEKNEKAVVSNTKNNNTSESSKSKKKSSFLEKLISPKRNDSKNPKNNENSKSKDGGQKRTKNELKITEENILSSFSLMEGNLGILNSVLSKLKENSEDLENTKLLEELAEMATEHKKKLGEYLIHIEEDDIMKRGLQLNSNLQKSLMEYLKFVTKQERKKYINRNVKDVSGVEEEEDVITKPEEFKKWREELRKELGIEENELNRSVDMEEKLEKEKKKEEEEKEINSEDSDDDRRMPWEN